MNEFGEIYYISYYDKYYINYLIIILQIYHPAKFPLDSYLFGKRMFIHPPD